MFSAESHQIQLNLKGAKCTAEHNKWILWKIPGTTQIDVTSITLVGTSKSPIEITNPKSQRTSEVLVEACIGSCPHRLPQCSSLRHAQVTNPQGLKKGVMMLWPLTPSAQHRLPELLRAFWRSCGEEDCISEAKQLEKGEDPWAKITSKYTLEGAEYHLEMQ